MSADEFDRPAVRLVEAAEVTQPMWLRPPERVRGGCRTVTDAGERCGHPRDAHVDSGYEGWRVSCRGCPCTSWSPPFDGVTIAAMVLILAGLAVFWLALVPALVEAWL